MKLKLPNVTLMCVDCVDVNRAVKLLEHCKSMVDFGDVRLLTSLSTDYKNKVTIMPLNTLIMYSVFMLTKVHEYINTSHVLVVQRDGFILNPDSWNNDWLKYDYIAPLFVQYDHVGSGGFSLRSKNLMEYVSEKVSYWNGTESHANELQNRLGYYEDGVLSFGHYKKLFKFAPLEEACEFAQGGNRNPKYFYKKPFGFHRTWQQIDFKTGLVDSTDTDRDLSSTYDYEIDAL